MSALLVEDEEESPSSSSSLPCFVSHHLQMAPDRTNLLKSAMIMPPVSAVKNSPISLFLLWCEDVDCPVYLFIDCTSLYDDRGKNIHHVVRPPVHHLVANGHVTPLVEMYLLVFSTV